MHLNVSTAVALEVEIGFSLVLGSDPNVLELKVEAIFPSWFSKVLIIIPCA